MLEEIKDFASMLFKIFDILFAVFVTVCFVAAISVGVYLIRLL